jgi:hypothetical protein
VRSSTGLFIAILLILGVLVCRWRGILHRWRRPETQNTPAPSLGELLRASIITLAFGLLFVQFIAIAYAMAYTLSSSTMESKDTVATVLFDVDGDGDLDYAAANNNGLLGESSIDLYKNDGSGGFGTHSAFGSSLGVTSAAAGDVDGDGDGDLIVSRNNGGENLSLYTNDGAGSFTLTGIAATGVQATRLADVDGDGDLDIVVVKLSGTANGVWLNDGAGNFSAAASTLPAGDYLATADFDGDGDIDLATSVQTDQNVRILQNSGTGAFTQISATGTLDDTRSLAAGDLDGDGDIDFAVTLSTGLVAAFFNGGDGTLFSAGTTFGTVEQARSLAFGDLDNDGDLDAIIGGADPGALPNGGNETWMNNGVGVFTQTGTPTEETDCTKSVALGDIDADGDLDYVAGNDNAICSGAGGVNRHYKSDQAATLANAAPSAPASGFSATATGSASLTSAGPKNSASGSDDSGTGTVAWFNPGNITANDGTEATIGLTQGSISHFLIADDFNFSIPTAASIRGIRVEWTLRRAAGEPRDAAVRVVKNGVVGAADRSTNSIWPGAETYVAYGSPGDLWGETWTPADINASAFGTAFVARQTLAGVGGGSIDHVRITVYYVTTANITLGWAAGSDAITPAALLQYQTRVGTASNANDVVSGRVVSPNYTDRLMPGASKLQRVVKGVACGATYYWSVKTVDSGLRLSGESMQQTITIDNDCTGSGGGGTTGGTSGGGGLGYWLQGKNTEGGAAVVPTGKITGQLFVDLNANGKKEKSERGGFAGVRLTARGKDLQGLENVKTAVAGKNGMFELVVPAGTYAAEVQDPSGILKGYTATGPLTVNELTVGPGLTAEAAFGWRSGRMLGYKPCLRIGEVDLRVGRTQAEALLESLADRYGRRINIEHNAVLVSRREFVLLLARTQCLEAEADSPRLRERLREQAREVGRDESLMRDLPLLAGAVSDEWARTAYTLLAGGIPVARLSKDRLVMDARAPVTRREAMGMVAAMLQARPPDGDTTLPPDATEADREAGTFAALKALDVLPLGFERTMNAGLTWPEAAELLLRSAFVGGKIPLGAAPDEEHWNDADVPEYLESAQTIGQRACIVQDATRGETVGSSLPPGGAEYLKDRLRLLLTVGTPDESGRVRWLITGQPSDYGVRAGVVRVAPELPVTRVALLHALLVATCHPLETFAEAEQRLAGGEVDVGGGGTADRIFSPDRYTGAADTPEFASRVLHSAQRPIREYNLSLFSFTPDLLRADQTRHPNGTVSINEAGKLLTSAMLYTRVKSGTMTRLRAEETFSELQASILRELTGVAEDDMWRLGNVGDGKALTWGQLVVFLSDVLGPELAATPLPSKPDGEAWWDAIARQ